MEAASDPKRRSRLSSLARCASPCEPRGLYFSQLSHEPGNLWRGFWLFALQREEGKEEKEREGDGQTARLGRS